MSTTLSGTRITGSIATSAANGASGTNAVNDGTSQQMATGSSAGQAQYPYNLAFSVTSGSPLTIDLTSVTDVNGFAVTFAAVTHIKFTAATTNTQLLALTGGASNPLYSDVDTVGAGDFVLKSRTQGIAVNSGAKTLTITSASGTQAGTLTILGR